ncbi:hypothetical protein Krac_3420 [Ktedonobacter racemifer DSM 44963]|uniref:Uncharacterized protein n=1 Tax=Ktedonobacter racemifer DSM 44963 TaxID=485913 RepID=D6U1A3_KTERA|nr:hypothetical protein Krac_3420 [Ktedonobacter racemifer DSM 44963]
MNEFSFLDLMLGEKDIAQTSKRRVQHNRLYREHGEKAPVLMPVFYPQFTIV